jgi:hypothetical protein
VQTFVHELRYPATTDAERLAAEMAKRHDGRAHERGLRDLPLDRRASTAPRRSTGCRASTSSSATRRTAPPAPSSATRTRALRAGARRRLHPGGQAPLHDRHAAHLRRHGQGHGRAGQRRAVLDGRRGLYGPELYVITFSEAVKRGLLVDYKVIVLAVEEAHVSRRLQSLLKDENNELRVDDAAKIVGCWKALAKQGCRGARGRHEPMKRAVAFCQVIERQSPRPRSTRSARSTSPACSRRWSRPTRRASPRSEADARACAARPSTSTAA